MGSERPVTFDDCEHVGGPFYHGTKTAMKAGDELVPGYGSNYQEGRISTNVYFTSRLEVAAWGAQLSAALAGSEDRGRIYVVEPVGPFEDDPNVTDKKLPGNPTRSFRTRGALRVVVEVDVWESHPPEALQAMLDGLAVLRAEGRDVILD